jgi:toxin YqcG
VYYDPAPWRVRSGRRHSIVEQFMTRELTYEVNGEKVVIQAHSAGHQYQEVLGPQHNVRPTDPKGNPIRNGKVGGAKDHYYFDYRNRK